jgi:protein-S-isoprenylcysteine O-methyltransferase Ste14
MNRYYPQLLVLLQFGIILVMIVLTALAPLFSWMGIALFLLGASVGLWAIRHNPPDNFNIIPELKEGCCLVTSGIYRYIRHPMYTSVILMMLGVLLFRPVLEAWLLWGVLIIVLYLKAHREERLWAAHDNAYKTYREKSRYFIPFIL